MTDTAQASNVASNSAVAASAMLDHAALCRRFDGRMHGLMAQAKSEDDWNSISTILLKALENKNLRANVRRRFVKECPHHDLTIMIEMAILLEEKPASRVNNTEADELFDSRQMKAMDRAKNKLEWEDVLWILAAAEKRSNLRTEVRVYFCDLCPYPSLVKEMKRVSGIV